MAEILAESAHFLQSVRHAPEHRRKRVADRVRVKAGDPGRSRRRLEDGANRRHRFPERLRPWSLESVEWIWRARKDGGTGRGAIGAAFRKPVDDDPLDILPDRKPLRSKASV
ncbi:hypothetical protein [Breoghania corrubedonensis]|uniref:hypothetical protein n=1 Tax=Breoghania corrubedonensis TaxID=665038 RepID=UPI0011B26E47|nr:hypothetical protein [Breoghania corrubedonensis]